MNKAKTVQNFISEEDCDYLVDTAISLDVWESGGNEFWDGRVINYTTMLRHNKKAASIMMDSNIRCKEIIDSQFGNDAPAYSDTIQVIRWFPGMEQHPHADDMKNTDIKGFEHRVFGSIIYLNDSYSGGHTFYPNFDFEIIPEKGKIAIHPGDSEHLHGVTKISGGIRYTIASFWTFDKDKAYEWPIY